MRRAACSFAVAVLFSILPTAPTATAQVAPGGFMSANVSWHGTIPIDSPGIGARVVDGIEHPVLGSQRRLYVTGSKGLSIYDVTNPATPVPLAHLALPHWENEDVAVSDDGNTVIISGDITGPILLVDASIVHAPRVMGVIPGGEHTVSCADPACDFLFGESGATYDIRSPLLPVRLTSGWQQTLGVELKQGAHDLNRDDAGIFITDTVPRLMFDLAPSEEYPGGDPRTPRLLTIGSPPDGSRVAYQHNNIRPKADQWAPRATGDDSGPLRPGELMLANGETNLTARCGQSNGPFATWSVKNFDRGQEMELLDVFRPVSGTYQDGNPAANFWGCSGHWFTFDEDIDVAAAAWYEHGTRFLHVDEGTGAITEVGFFQPVVGSAFAAYWVDDYIYVVDNARGIDILRFDPDPALRPSTDDIRTSWLAKLGVVDPVAEADRFACRLATDVA